MNFRELLENQIVTFDGAMGTLLYGEGISLANCFDALNVTRPDLVKRIHESYRKTGVHILETNTFGANRFRLAESNQSHQVEEINLAGVALAREAAQGKCLVAGSMGPLGKHLEPIGTIKPEEARSAYRAQAEALVSGGVDLLVLETISNLAEMQVALEEVVSLGVPVVALMTFTEEGKTVIGNKPREVARALSGMGAAAMGVNCSVGPQGMLEVLETMMPHAQVPVIAMPNAGLPRLVGGRYLYVSSPEYLADFARKAADLGVGGVGGCCGTTPEHIQAVVAALAGRKPKAHRTQSHVEIAPVPHPTPPEPGEHKSHGFFDKLGKTFAVSVELDPPRGLNIERFVRSAVYLKSKGADAINVADSPLARPRMSPLAFCHTIEQESGMETILHMSCRDRNLLATQSELMGAHVLGIKNILAITGDPVQLGGHIEATGVFDLDSVGLTRLISGLNQGRDLAGRAVDEPTDFRICVAANPTAIDVDEEIEKLRRKIDAGAQFIFTQPLYDPRDLENFFRRISDLPIPLCVGVLPLKNGRHAEFIHNEIPGMSVPENVRRRMHKAGENGMQEGVAIACEFLNKIQPLCAGAYLMPPFNKFEMAGDIMDTLVSRDVFSAPGR